MRRQGDADSAESRHHVAGLVTQRGEVIRARSVITSCDHFLAQGALTERSASSSSCRRMTVLLDKPLLGEDGVNLCVAPPGSLEPALANVVQVLQLDWSTGTCPRGHCVAHLSQAWMGPDDDRAFSDVERVLCTLLESIGGNKHCLLRCKYIHRPRSLVRWNSNCPDGEVLSACVNSRSLHVISDPVAVPQLLMSDEIDEARDVFLATSLGCKAPTVDDFLKKPEHVVQEERCSMLEELEQFTGQMNEVDKPSIPLQSDEPEINPSPSLEIDSSVVQ